MIGSGLSVFLKSRKSGERGGTFRFSSEIKNIRGAAVKVLGALSCFNIDPDKAFDIRLCIEEAVRNAMVHGNRSDKRLPVIVSYRVAAGLLTLEVEDRGEGFDYSSIKDPTEGSGLERNSGRGVYLIKKLMDSVSYNERGNKVTMTKRLNTADQSI
jgi:serine/threonine-protein kinase RsbW